MRALFLILGLTVSANVSLLAAANDPVQIIAPVDKIFIPNGFDDNDNVELVVHGNFPNTCYQIGSVETKVDSLNKEILVSASALKYPGGLCIQSITPFIQSVKLGILPEGSYKVIYAANNKVATSLSVERRKTESPDDFLYATVENAYIDINFETGKQALKLQGHFPYFFIGCMVMKEVRTYLSPSDVVVVQPIAEIVTTDVCDSQPSDRSFEYTSGLSQPFTGEGLLHVRTLNGSSINRFIDIK